MDSPVTPHNDHLRHLLDQRATRADVHHARFPSLSEFSDSPSIYSHARFSPRPIDRAELDAHTQGFHFAVPSQYRGIAAEARNRERDRDRLNDPAASMLDLDDDDTSYTSPTSPHPFRDHDSSSPEPDDPTEDEPDPRMSLLGPKMRFHSPAPWEVEEHPIHEQDEPDDDARSFVSRRGRNKSKGEGFMKGLGLGGSQIRGPSSSRPSGESTRSSGKDKRSFETTSSFVSVSHGALHALAQASMSSTSLAPPNGAGSRSRLTAARSRTRTNSNTVPPSTALPPRPPSPQSNAHPVHESNLSRSTSPELSVRSRTITRANSYGSSRPDSPLGAATDYVHPYANPDLAYDRGSLHISSIPSNPRPTPGRELSSSESAVTLPDSLTTRSSSPSRSASATTITMTPDTSVTSVGNSSSDIHSLRRGVGGVQGKSISGPISGPISVDHTPLRLVGSSIAASKVRDGKGAGQVNQLPGWSELPASPTFTLISLQEAQAQARERSRTATATGQIPVNVPFLQTEPPSRYTSESPSGIAGRARARSSSAGAKAKNALQSLTTGSSAARAESDVSPTPQAVDVGPQARVLKHKKSGFMRLFNGKEKERDREKATSVTPPPVSTSPAPPLPRTPKVSSARVPVPSLSPSLVTQNSGSYFHDVVKSDRDSDRESLAAAGQRLVNKRNGPSLTIIPPSEARQPQPHSASTPSPMSHIGDNRSKSTLVPESKALRVVVPLSAPASTTSFPALSLRPVSTIFSAHFADHIVEDESPGEMDPDTGTSTSGFSPLSLDYAMRSSEKPPTSMVHGDDPNIIIQALQEQITSTRKAWQHQIWELEGQVRDLRAEVDDFRAKEATGERCVLCGQTGAPLGARESRVNSRATTPSSGGHDGRHGVVNRPRARTGVGTRFGSGTE
ncbi:hypothetical protein FA95DRAFT_1675738 [Auriscalpium vulgare]|uniref:Uncharacterized protein n=1 Tax=Auriscalpium vulgare TaxID=40419 RepID=A0ACB8S5R8_9AGAM|nr:hypothetical protein FA95DRAFT_1675738 [Auriscalpium vulgare]